MQRTQAKWYATGSCWASPGLLNSGNHHLLDVSIDGVKWYAAKALRENSVTQMSEGKRKCIEDIPIVPLPPDWNNFQSKDIPSYFNYGHIHHYALESIEGLVTDYDEDGDCDLGHMTDKPLKNGRKYVDSGFVHDVMDAKSKDCYLKE